MEIAASDNSLDVVYLFRHSCHADLEMRYSLRSLAMYAPFVRKVWIFGSRPRFLTDDTSLVEHVPHEYMAPLLGVTTPIRSDFLMLTLASLIPEVGFDFVRFSDDYVLLNTVTRKQLTCVRAVEDLTTIENRGRGKWKDTLWRTYDLLRQHGYGGVNFESHTPQWMTRKMVFETFMAFRPYLSENRYEGILSPTAIGNYAVKHHGLPFVWLTETNARAGFYGTCPTTTKVMAECEGKHFLNFDDGAFGPPLQQFLQALFPIRCKFERR